MSDSENKAGLPIDSVDAAKPASFEHEALPDCTSPSINLLMQTLAALARDEQPSAEVIALFDDIYMTVGQTDKDSDPTLVFEAARLDDNGILHELPALAGPLDEFMARLSACANEIEGIAIEGRSISFDHPYSLLELVHAYVAEHNIVTWDTLELFCGIDPPGKETPERLDETDLQNMTPVNLAEVFYHLARQGAETNRMPGDGAMNDHMLYHLPGRPYHGKADIDAMTSKMTKLYNGSASARTCTISLEQIEAAIHDETKDETDDAPMLPSSLCNPYYRLH